MKQRLLESGEKFINVMTRELSGGSTVSHWVCLLTYLMTLATLFYSKTGKCADIERHVNNVSTEEEPNLCLPVLCTTQLKLLGDKFRVIAHIPNRQSILPWLSSNSAQL